MPSDLARTAKDRGIKYFLISYTDLFGTQRAKLVPAAAIGEMQKAGAAFAGFATWLDMTPADSDLFALPDPASLIRVVLRGAQSVATDPAPNAEANLRTYVAEAWQSLTTIGLSQCAVAAFSFALGIRRPPGLHCRGFDAFADI